MLIEAKTRQSVLPETSCQESGRHQALGGVIYDSRALERRVSLVCLIDGGGSFVGIPRGTDQRPEENSDGKRVSPAQSFIKPNHIVHTLPDRFVRQEGSFRILHAMG